MAKKNASAFIKADDFKSKEYAVLVTNLGTKMDFKSGITFVGFDETHVQLRVPRVACAMGHRLLVRVLPKESLSKVDQILKGVEFSEVISATAKVMELEPATADTIIVTVELNQYEEKQWLAFIETHGEIQEGVDKLLKRMKE